MNGTIVVQRITADQPRPRTATNIAGIIEFSVWGRNISTELYIIRLNIVESVRREFRVGEQWVPKNVRSSTKCETHSVEIVVALYSTSKVVGKEGKKKVGLKNTHQR